RRILHRDRRRPFDKLPDAGFELLPAEVDRAIAGEMVEDAVLNAVDELVRLPVGRDPVKPAARGGQIFREMRDAPGEDVEAAEVVEEPAVEVEGLESGLNGGEVEHGSRVCRFSVIGHGRSYVNRDRVYRLHATRSGPR